MCNFFYFIIAYYKILSVFSYFNYYLVAFNNENIFPVVHILGWQIRLNIHSATEPECIYNRSHSWLMEFKLVSLPSVERETHRLSWKGRTSTGNSGSLRQKTQVATPRHRKWKGNLHASILYCLKLSQTYNTTFSIILKSNKVKEVERTSISGKTE